MKLALKIAAGLAMVVAVLAGGLFISVCEHNPHPHSMSPRCPW